MANMAVSYIATSVSNAGSISTRSPVSGGASERPPAAPAVEAAFEPAQRTASKLEQTQMAIERVKQSIKPALANTLEFEIDQSTGKTVVKITDITTNSLVRQIPSEEMLIIAHALDNMQGRGGLVKQKA